MSEVQFPEVGSIEETYHPQDAIGAGTKSSLALGGTGLFIAAVQNSISKENVGTFGVVSRFGGTVALFGMSGHNDSRQTSTNRSQLLWEEPTPSHKARQPT